MSASHLSHDPTMEEVAHDPVAGASDRSLVHRFWDAASATAVSPDRQSRVRRTSMLASASQEVRVEERKR